MYRTRVDHHLQAIYNSLDQINTHLNTDPYRDIYNNTPSYSGPYREPTEPYRGSYRAPTEPYRGPYSEPLNSRRSYNTTRTTRSVEPETSEFHIRLNEPINLSDLPTPNSIASLFTNRENERTNVKLINDNTEITAHTNETPINCSICREDINRDNNIKRKINHCNHEFHQKCLDKWFETKKTCPMCRYELNDIPTIGQNRVNVNTTSVNNLD